jgi:hypothetical protein
MRTVPAAVAAALLLVLAACEGATPPTAPTDPVPAAPSVAPRADGAPVTTPNSPSEVARRRLERAADGLLYTSESDYPFEYYFRPARVEGELTVEAFRAAAGVPTDAVVEELSLDAFLARHIERVDPSDAAAAALVPRYERLRTTIEATVRDPRVFRVGRILIRCFVVGTDRYGNLVGLTTFAVET